MKPESLIQTSPDLASYLAEYGSKGGRQPLFCKEVPVDDASDRPDLLYPVSEGVFAHIHPTPGGLSYTIIEPRLLPGEDTLINRVREALFQAAARARPTPGQTFERALTELLDRLFQRSRGSAGLEVPPERLPRLRYLLIRDLARYGLLEPLMMDPHVEDIQCVGTAPIHVIHKTFGMLTTNIQFPNLLELEAYLKSLSERIGRPVSDARPIVDATLPGGSRINIVFPNDVSRKGPSFSIRRSQTEPVSITRLLAWRTLSPELAAYLWLCLENNMSLFVCGEAACGKTTTVNALLTFVNHRAKVFTAEDTPEIQPPHAVWQRLLTRETGPEESRVHMFDLLRTALRSRPNYIVVGEIRGAEGAIAFQAMQTGHPTVATFHAENKQKMIQRLTSDPINIPVSFLDNLNVAVFQQAITTNGRTRRRVTAVDEIEGYSEFAGGVVTRPAFTYEPFADRQHFKAYNNSFVLEQKIAAMHGYADRKEIYEEMNRRARFLEDLARRRVFSPAEVDRSVRLFVEATNTAATHGGA